MFRIIVAAVCLVGVGCSASAQSIGDDSQSPAKPSFAGINGSSDYLQTFKPSSAGEILRHRDFAGQPCLIFEGFARPHTINPNLYDDVVAITNNCPRHISVRLCYTGNDDCISVDVPGSERKEAILGMLPAIKNFSFEFHEKFDN